ncbi:MAG: dihydrofolate reductase [Bacteroidetes bacterium]|nr:dihydrofolate reductase [Bacteroidota bacterium]
MIISIVVAASRNGVIGVDNTIPWHLPDDLKYFRKLTTGHHVIMGRKTFESIGKPLPNRTNLVITRNPDLAMEGVTILPTEGVTNFQAEGVYLLPSFAQTVDQAFQAGETEAFVIGGSEIYRIALPHTRKLYYTRVETWVEEGHAFFPEPDDSWVLQSEQHHPADERHAFPFTFQEYERRQAVTEEGAVL